MEPKQTLTVDEIDLSDLTFWARPLAYMPAREIQMPSAIELPEMTGYYAVTRHADILEASKHPELFCSGKGATSQLDMPEVFLEFFGSMINLDDPRHARLRRIVSTAFTPKMIKTFEDHVQVAADQIVDAVIDKGECDFVTEVAARLPLKIICDMMGIGESDYDFVFNKSNVILGATDPEYVPEGGDIAVALLSAGAELAQLVTALGQERQKNPTEDLTSALVNANVDGEQLTDSELASFFILLVVAGNETTRNAISHGMRLLTDHPDQRKAWLDDFDRVTSTAVEEIVRVASPVIFMRRTATQDTTLGGHALKEGDKLMLYYWSANRDEDVFDDPYRFDVKRDPNPHVGFGGPGPHFCLGAHLARREITVMFRELLRRIPDIETSGEPSRLLSGFINGIKHLPVTFTPGGAAA